MKSKQYTVAHTRATEWVNLSNCILPPEMQLVLKGGASPWIAEP